MEENPTTLIHTSLAAQETPMNMEIHNIQQYICREIASVEVASNYPDRVIVIIERWFTEKLDF